MASTLQYPDIREKKQDKYQPFNLDMFLLEYKILVAQFKNRSSNEIPLLTVNIYATLKTQLFCSLFSVQHL